jgi:hypothetical protein
VSAALSAETPGAFVAQSVEVRRIGQLHAVGPRAVDADNERFLLRAQR